MGLTPEEIEQHINEGMDMSDYWMKRGAAVARKNMSRKVMKKADWYGIRHADVDAAIFVLQQRPGDVAGWAEASGFLQELSIDLCVVAEVIGS
jgi:hypothetical protein